MTGSVYVQEMEALPAAVELKVDDEYEAEYGPGMDPVSTHKHFVCMIVFKEFWGL